MLSVNAYGGSFALNVRLERGQSILLVNRMTRQEQECRVAHISPLKEGKWIVGVEFAKAATNFWRIHFPTEAALRGPGLKTA